jgi:hypothetical protein
MRPTTASSAERLIVRVVGPDEVMLRLICRLHDVFSPTDARW